jgi:DNA-binding transcriptional ArsR family regulator
MNSRYILWSQSSRDNSRSNSIDVVGSIDYDRKVSSEERPEPRKLTDARTLRALAHPVRIALYEELAFGGPMTATELAKRIGETPTACSFHLRQLAKYGFVEEAGGGKGRNRPWRLTSSGWNIPIPHDRETQVAGDAVLRLSRERAFARYQRWQATKAGYAREWLESADDSDYLSYVTAEELKQVNQELHAVLERFRDRLADPARRPPGAVPVETLLLSYPIEPPPGDSGPGPHPPGPNGPN